MHENIDKNQFLEETSLYQIFMASSNIRLNRFNIIFTIIFLLLCVLDLAFGGYSASEIASLTRSIANQGLSLTIGLLGFLVAGFAIFSSITSPKLSLFMASKINPESGLSYLKHNYFNFVNVFTFYFFAVFVFFCVLIFGNKSGAAFNLMNKLPEFYFYIIICFIYLLVICCCIYVIILLKSFVYNIYHSVMTALRHEYDVESERLAKISSPTPAEPPL